MKYIDVHAHTNFAIYDDDRSQVIQKTIENDVMVINVGTQQSTSQKAVDLAKNETHMYAIVGLHPIHTTASYHDKEELGDENEFTSRGEIFDTAFYKALIHSSEKVVGIGECGLDYYRNDESTKTVQENAFRAQIELAIDTQLPLMLHVRPSEGTYDAYYDVLNILKEYKRTHEKLTGNVHFFAGTPDIAKEFIDLGFYISFTGVITFSDDYRELVKAVPVDRILSETDAPYVAPVPFRGQRNEPSHVIKVVEKIADIKELYELDLAKQIMINAKKLFNIK